MQKRVALSRWERTGVREYNGLHENMFSSQDAVLVNDTGMGPANGARVLETAQKLAGDRRILLTLTHFHPEHGYGAQAFKGAAEIVYNVAQRDELQQKGEPYLGMQSPAAIEKYAATN